MADLKSLEARALAELAACGDEASLRAWHTKYFGKEGEVPAALKKIVEVPPDQKRAFGQEANRVKQALTLAFDAADAKTKEQALARSLAADALDVTLPGRAPPRGRLHVATRVMREIYGIFADLGFQVYRSREVEDDLTNFELLNMPPHHPARDMWDTFHTTTPGVILRTHTSPGQIHVMRELCPEPIRVILPGMCYRYEAVTTRSEIQFQQVEGLAIGAGVTMADLKGTITAFARRLFGQERRVRLRSSYFPFTEPSIEVDIDWPRDDPNADRLTKGTGWLEIMGAGMVHPVVLRNGGYDPDRFSGFAFGMGPQRITMLKYAIDDIRQFWLNDLRFLRQF
ncbi:MAG TPA: phenylalanine--tRNA ligase subunit alpha [Gemmataceae bacterium]|jgi:phenylalanyl-tRNA synthetase alpha chain|nr:phenylalanine--tRNA ligase subunit alpha [Gemmataceae bacterium]